MGKLFGFQPSSIPLFNQANGGNIYCIDPPPPQWIDIQSEQSNPSTFLVFHFPTSADVWISTVTEKAKCCHICISAAQIHKHQLADGSVTSEPLKCWPVRRRLFCYMESRSSGNSKFLLWIRWCHEKQTGYDNSLSPCTNQVSHDTPVREPLSTAALSSHCLTQ